MDLKYHAALSAALAALYLAFPGGDFRGAAVIMLVGVGMDADHVFSYLYKTRDFSAGLLRNTYAHYQRAIGWLCRREGEPYETLDFMLFHNFEVALLVLFGLGGTWLFLPAAIGYLGHMALDLTTWRHLVFGIGTRTPGQAASYFSVACRLLLAAK